MREPAGIIGLLLWDMVLSVGPKCTAASSQAYKPDRVSGVKSCYKCIDIFCVYAWGLVTACAVGLDPHQMVIPSIENKHLSSFNISMHEWLCMAWCGYLSVGTISGTW